MFPQAVTLSPPNNHFVVSSHILHYMMSASLKEGGQENCGIVYFLYNCNPLCQHVRSSLEAGRDFFFLVKKGGLEDLKMSATTFSLVAHTDGAVALEQRGGLQVYPASLESPLY